MSSTPANGHIFTFTGPSGTGKDTVMNAMISRDTNLHFFPTATTRPPRPYEKDGVDYHFLDHDTFKARLADGEVLEWNEYHGNFYGTLKSVVEECLTHGKDIITDITWSGAAAIRKAFPDSTVCICIMPPNYEALLERMAGRKKVTSEDDEIQRIRTKKVKVDLQYASEPGYIFTNEDMIGSRLTDYDHVIINETLDETLTQMTSVLAKTRSGS